MRRTAVLLVLVLTGLVLVSLPDLLKRAVVWEELSRNAGLAILLTATIALLEPILTRWLSEPTSARDDFGLIEIKRSRQAAQDELAELVQSADKVKIVSTCLHPFLASHKEKLLDNLQRQASNGRTAPIRIVLVDPASEGLVERRMIDTLESIDKRTDGTLIQWVKGIEGLVALAEKYPRALEVRLSPLAVPASVFILDDHLYVTPYVFGERGSTSFCYHFTKKGRQPVYELYDRNFERLWIFLAKATATVVPGA